MAKFCNQCGRPLAEGEICQCRRQEGEAAGEKKNTAQESAALCEQEVFVKQYHICNIRSGICRLEQEGRIQVTSKRIIFHLDGHSRNKRTMSHTEFAIDEVTGISVSCGVRFSVQIMTKYASYELTHMGNRPGVLSAIKVLPGKDADIAAGELGAMILDIQELGDSGAEKWKAD
ncbi:hypothetical protein [Muricomes intestini]|jgi:hypothetical protein|uniref:hypothetical protein n=1 Tax=Muricomes intestini TaxID=1796634 RepID=UPI002FDE19C3